MVIPIDLVDAYDSKVVTLKLDQYAVNALPRLIVKWHKRFGKGQMIMLVPEK